MKPRRWMKMPDGRLTEPRADPLALFLAAPRASAYAAPPPVTAPRDANPPSSRRQDYATDSFDIRKVAGHEVTAFGAGSGGSHLVHALGPAGLTINAVDPGMVQARHTTGGRTIYDPTQIGLKKIHALKEKMERNFPGTIINALPYHTAEIPDSQIKSLLSRSLVAVLAIDDPGQIVRISDLAYPITELIQPAVHARGESGHIAICVPFITPCLRCTLGIEDANDITRLDSEPAAGLDIIVVAQQAARIALDIIYSKVTGRHITRWDTSKNLIYIANTKQEISQDGPGICFESRRKRPGCSICDNPYGRMKGPQDEH